MTQENVIAVFDVQVYTLFNREAFQLPIGTCQPESPVISEQKTGLSFIPLYSSPRTPLRSTPPHAQVREQSPVHFPTLKRQTTLTKSLSNVNGIADKLKIPEARLKNCDRLLTSAETIRAMEAKEREKLAKTLAQEESGID